MHKLVLRITRVGNILKYLQLTQVIIVAGSIKLSFSGAEHLAPVTSCLNHKNIYNIDEIDLESIDGTIPNFTSRKPTSPADQREFLKVAKKYGALQKDYSNIENQRAYIESLKQFFEYYEVPYTEVTQRFGDGSTMLALNVVFNKTKKPKELPGFLYLASKISQQYRELIITFIPIPNTGYVIDNASKKNASQFIMLGPQGFLTSIKDYNTASYLLHEFRHFFFAMRRREGRSTVFDSGFGYSKSVQVITFEELYNYPFDFKKVLSHFNREDASIQNSIKSMKSRMSIFKNNIIEKLDSLISDFEKFMTSPNWDKLKICGELKQNCFSIENTNSDYYYPKVLIYNPKGDFFQLDLADKLQAESIVKILKSFPLNKEVHLATLKSITKEYIQRSYELRVTCKKNTEELLKLLSEGIFNAQRLKRIRELILEMTSLAADLT